MIKSNRPVRFSIGLHQILAAMLQEIRMIGTDAGVLIIILAVPVLYPVLYSFIYYPEVVRNLPVAVVDHSRTAVSREYIRHLDATPEINVTCTTPTMEEAISAFRRREIRGIVSIPESFSSDLALGRQTTISAYADMEFFLYYKALVSGTSFVTIDANKNIQVRNLMDGGLTAEQAEIMAEPLTLSDNAMSNPSGGFASYGIPAALILIIQQTIILAIGIVAGTLREKHPAGILIVHDHRFAETIRQLTGKAAAYFLVYAVLSIYMLKIIPGLFGYSDNLDFYELVVLISPFLLSSIFFGLALSVFFRNRESPMMLYLFTSIPLLFLSGIIWPLSGFSPLWLAVREIFPSSDAMFGYIKMSALAADLTETGREISNLWLKTFICFVLACVLYSGKLIQQKSKLKTANGIQLQSG
jgi:ABC-2 type transport system permease protein